MSQPETRIRESSRIHEADQFDSPKLFKVLLHNDHYTTMDFVVEILCKIFHKAPTEAVQIMMRVHHGGVGIAGVYPAQVAEAKALAVHDYAQARGFPLKCSVEPE